MSFLSDVAGYLKDNHGNNLGSCTVVFPNRRAGIFLKKELAKKLDSPVWSPETLSLEDFLFTFTSVKKADALTLIFELYESFKAHQSEVQDFESFYHWGEMLLRDFEEVDHYQIDPKQIFSLIRDEKELEESFYFLDSEQEAVIRKFWKDFLPYASNMQENFLKTWKILLPVYDSFKKQLQEKGIGYSSHIYKLLSESLEHVKINPEQTIVFAGFNALTPIEELLIKFFITEYNAEVIWDLDGYYLDDEHQEAGYFLRKYRNDPLFAPTFPVELPNKINLAKSIESVGVSLEIGQAKLISERINGLIEEGAKAEEIVVILPKEYMLFPILNTVPSTIEKLNVTMGYPLKDTPLFGLLEASIELQEHIDFSPENGISFYYKNVLDILSHPFLYSGDKNPWEKFINEINRKNQIRLYESDFSDFHAPILGTIFKKADPEKIISYLQEILVHLVESVQERYGLEREYIYHFQQLLQKHKQEH